MRATKINLAMLTTLLANHRTRLKKRHNGLSIKYTKMTTRKLKLIAKSFCQFSWHETVIDLNEKQFIKASTQTLPSLQRICFSWEKKLYCKKIFTITSKLCRGGRCGGVICVSDCCRIITGCLRFAVLARVGFTLWKIIFHVIPFLYPSWSSYCCRICWRQPCRQVSTRIWLVEVRCHHHCLPTF